MYLSWEVGVFCTVATGVWPGRSPVCALFDAHYAGCAWWAVDSRVCKVSETAALALDVVGFSPGVLSGTVAVTVNDSGVV